MWLTTRKKDYSGWGDALVGAWSLAAGAAVTLAAFSLSMPVQYAVYTAVGTTYHATITIARCVSVQQGRISMAIDELHAEVYQNSESCLRFGSSLVA